MMTTLEKVLPEEEVLVVPHPCIGTRKLKRATLLLAATYLTPRRRGFGLVHLAWFIWFLLFMVFFVVFIKQLKYMHRVVYSLI